MADTINIDILSYTNYPKIVPVVNLEHPVYDYSVTEHDLLKLIQFSNYRIYEAGTKNIINGTNISKYFSHGGGGGEGGVTRYPDLTDLPKINGTTLRDNKTAVQLNLMSIPAASSSTQPGQILTVKTISGGKITEVSSVNPSTITDDLDVEEVTLNKNQTLKTIKEEDGKISTTTQDIEINSEQVVTMKSYVKPVNVSDNDKSIKPTDTLNTAIGKLEYAIDNKESDNLNIKQGNGILFSNKIEDDIEYTVINNNGVISISNSTEKANTLIVTIIDPDDTTKTKDIELPYNLQIASKTQKGIVKIGDGFNIVDGKLDILLGDGLSINDNGFITIKHGKGLKVNKITGDIEVNVGEGLSIDEDGKINYTGTKTTYTSGSGISIDIDETDENNSIITNTGILDIKKSDNVNKLIKTVFDKETNSSKDIEIEIKTDTNVATVDTAGIVKPGDGLSIDKNGTVSFNIGEGLEIDEDGSVKSTGIKNTYTGKNGICIIGNPDNDHDKFIINNGVLSIKESDETNEFIFSYYNEETSEIIEQPIKIVTSEIALATAEKPGVIQPSSGLSIDENGLVQVKIGKDLKFNEESKALEIVTDDELNEETLSDNIPTSKAVVEYIKTELDKKEGKILSFKTKSDYETAVSQGKVPTGTFFIIEEDET